MGLKKKKGKKKEKNVRLYIVSNGTIYKFIYIYILLNKICSTNKRTKQNGERRRGNEEKIAV